MTTVCKYISQKEKLCNLDHMARSVQFRFLLCLGSLPYDGETDARAAVKEARERARQEGKFLMVTFGANWCPDCRNLHRHLKSDVVRSYTNDRFLFVNVDVGKLNQNRDLAQELGVSLRRGIPVAADIFLISR